ncbi:MAG: hypothetical protein J1E05_01730 [Eubacterium sp.]|nr:hypothetical protein [Eubacterium sp.]
MFYKFEDEIITVDPKAIDPHCLTAGYVTLNEFKGMYESFGFSRSNFDCCKSDGSGFGSTVEIYDDYSFAVLNITDAQNVYGERDCIGIFIKKNLFIVVDIEDKDCSTRDNFLNSLKRYSCISITLEKLIFSFLDNLIKKDSSAINERAFEITKLEEQVLKDKATDKFNFLLLGMKKELLILRNFYEQLIDVGEALDDNENEVFEESDLRYLLNFTDRVKRQKENIDMLRSSVDHLQDAYSAYLDVKSNHIMTFFTVITTIFFPLTLIVGWYGMNFTNMPELTWKYGYLFVIILSVVVVAVLTFIMKKRKWL